MRHRFSPVTLEAQLNSIELSEFVFTETTHPPRFTLTRRVHERANVLFVSSAIPDSERS